MDSKYRLLYDYHTHTTFSHGKGSIEDNVKEALAKGLKGVGISDHGPGHRFYGIKREALPEMRKEVNRLRQLYPQIEIYLSIEANIIARPPYIDTTPEDEAQLDYLIAGYHYGIGNSYTAGNLTLRYLPFLSGKDQMVRNTDMTMMCIYENDLKILTHPGDKGPFDIEEIAKACADNNVLMEINMKHPGLTEEGIRIAAKEDVSFVISSDAHTAENVGTFDTAINRALAAGLDLERIVNIEKI